MTTIGARAFNDCNSRTFIQFPDSVTAIDFSAFSYCVSLSSMTIGSGITRIGEYAFNFCTRLVTLTITGNSLTNLGTGVFQNCWDLQGVYFTSNAPSPEWESSMFAHSYPTVFYLPGTTGWGETFAGRPTAVWQISIDTPVVEESGFGFRITGPDSEESVLEVCTNLAQGVWTPIETNTLLNGFFSTIRIGPIIQPAIFESQRGFDPRLPHALTRGLSLSTQTTPAPNHSEP